MTLVAGTLGCKKARPGEPCTSTGDNQCTGPDSALICVDGKLSPATCAGSGCQKSPFACDYREAPHAAPCFEASSPAAPMACSADKKARVRCVKGSVERDACDGPKGCYSKSETTMGCDRALRVGSACSTDGDWCSDVGDEWLQCKDGRLQVAAKCRGPGRCKPFGDTIACDTSVGVEGEPCVGKTATCSVDKRAVLRCDAGRLRMESACPTGKTCDPAHAGCS